MEPGELIRTLRERRGLSQARLARRMSTGQSAISRLENDEVSPTVETLRLALLAMGESLRLGTGTDAESSSRDPLHDRDWLARAPEERLRMAISWNRLAGRLQEAGRKAGEAR